MHARIGDHHYCGVLHDDGTVHIYYVGTDNDAVLYHDNDAIHHHYDNRAGGDVH